MYALIGWMSSAWAADGPALWTRAAWAAAWHPVGVMAEGTAELRAPVLRYGGVAFNDTCLGIGARIAVTPVHVDLAARLSAQPIDLLPITVELVHSSYWESPWGLVPADSIEDQTPRTRKPLYDADRDFAGSAWSVVVAPTLQARAGPVAAFTNVAFTWTWLQPRQGPEPWVFEPYRGLVMGYQDLVVEHTSAVLWEAADGEEGPIVRVGPALRGKNASATGDHSLMLGGVVQWRPGELPTAPTFLLIVAPYLRDPDFAGPVPFVAAQVTFERESVL